MLRPVVLNCFAIEVRLSPVFTTYTAKLGPGVGVGRTKDGDAFGSAEGLGLALARAAEQASAPPAGDASERRLLGRQAAIPTIAASRAATSMRCRVTKRRLRGGGVDCRIVVRRRV